MTHPSKTQAEQDGRERIQPIVAAETATWLRVRAAEERVSQGEIVDRLVKAASASK